MILRNLRETVEAEGKLNLDELMIIRDKFAYSECKVENPKVRSAWRSNLLIERYS